MARIKVRFTLNPGREGIAWGKLARQSQTIDNLLVSISEDLGLPQDKWIAKDFADGSYISNAELEAVIEADKLSEFNNYWKELIRFDEAPRNEVTAKISKKTAIIFSELRSPLDIDEKIGISLYGSSSGKSDEQQKITQDFFVTKLRLQEIADSIETETTYMGAVVGYTYEWNKGAKEPFIKIRDVATKELIKCTYSNNDYQSVSKLFENKESLVTIYGLVIYDWVNNKTELRNAKGFEVSPPPLDSDEYRSFFGCAEGMSGGLDAAEYVRKLRGE